MLATGALVFPISGTVEKVFGSFGSGTPTAIRLLAFNVTPSDGQVSITWTTGAEIGNEGFNIEGFNILRSPSRNGPFAKINPSMIPAKGVSPSGASYHFIDLTVANGRTYYYKLEDIDTLGMRTAHNTVTAALKEAFFGPASFSASFRAFSDHQGITLEWAGASPYEQFNILRSRIEAGAYTQINHAAISAISALDETTERVQYTYTDTAASAGQTYYYKLERISAEGESRFIGPIPATPRIILGQLGQTHSTRGKK